MKKRFLLIGSLAFMQFVASAQAPKDTTVRKLNRTDIELVYNHYMQDGNNSAVTGGIGTEKLTVYGPAMNLKSVWGSNTLSYKFGGDVVSSASTDRINFVMSSASSLDTRYHGYINYARQVDKHRMEINGGFGLSIESDYMSIAGDLGFVKKDRNNMRSFSAQLQVFNDDLRWVRKLKSAKLIYPEELRYREWHDAYLRHSYNLKLGFTQILNKRLTLGVFPELSYQFGLLSTPFHRIYFSNGTKAVENLPNERLKGAMAVRLNAFVGGKVILKNTLSGYGDSFRIMGFAFEHETAIKLKPYLSLLPNFRIYTQSEATYFAPYGAHDSEGLFHTSDFDLSAFETYTVGIGLNYHPQKYLTERFVLNGVQLRYAYFHRTNGLNGHVLSVAVQTSVFEKAGR